MASTKHDLRSKLKLNKHISNSAQTTLIYAKYKQYAQWKKHPRRHYVNVTVKILKFQKLLQLYKNMFSHKILI